MTGDGERVELHDWDLSDPADRYELAFHLSRTHRKRLSMSLVITLTIWLYVGVLAAGAVLRSDAWWYLTRPLSSLWNQPPVGVLPFALAALVPWAASYSLWVRYDAPDEGEIRALYAAAEQWDSVYRDDE